MAETQEILSTKRKQSQSDEHKRHVTWLSRSGSSPRKSILPIQSLGSLSPSMRRKAEIPIEIPLNKSHKSIAFVPIPTVTHLTMSATGQVLVQQLLNTSWDQPPVVSLWEVLEAEENDRIRMLMKFASSPSKRASRKVSPRDSRPGMKAFATTARRKSCECLQCGGISDLELRTAHIQVETSKPENSKSNNNTRTQTPKHSILGEDRRGSFQLIRGSSYKSTMKNGRGLFQSLHVNINSSVSPLRSKRNQTGRSSFFSEETDSDKLQENNGKDDGSKSSKRLSLVFDGTPLQSPSNSNMRVRELVNLALTEKLPDRIVKSQDGQGEADKPQSRNEERKLSKENSPIKLKNSISQNQTGHPPTNNLYNQLQEQLSQKKELPSNLKGEGLFDILQERFEESPKIKESHRAKSSNKASGMTFSLISSMLESPVHKKHSRHHITATHSEKPRNLLKTSIGFSQTASDPLPKDVSKQGHSDPKRILKNLFTPKRTRGEIPPGQRLQSISLEKKAETTETAAEENKDEPLPPVVLNINRDEDIKKVYFITSSLLRPRQPISKSISHSPGRKILGTSSQEMTIKLLQKENEREDTRLSRLVKSRDQRINLMSSSRSRLNSSISRGDSKKRFKHSLELQGDSKVETLEGAELKSPVIANSNTNHLPVITSHSSPEKTIAIYSNRMAKGHDTKFQKRILEKNMVENKALLRNSFSIKQTLSTQ